MNGTIDIKLGSIPTLSTAIHNYTASGGTSINVDLSNYYTKVTVDSKLNNKVDVVEGKGLSTNDYTTIEKTKLQGLSNYDDSVIKNSISDEVTNRLNGDNSLSNSISAETARATAAEAQLQKNIDGKTVDLSNYALSSDLAKYESTSAHTTDITALQTAIDSKLNKSDYAPTDFTHYYTKATVDDKLLAKVDVVEGKNLSTNDYTTAEKTKLQGLSNYDDSAIKNSIADETERAEAAEVILQKNIDGKQDKGNYVSASQLSNYETIIGHNTDITTLQSSIDTKLNKSDYAPVDLSNYYQKNQTSGATQIAAAISDLSSKIPTTLSLKVLSQADYDALANKDDNTVYFIQ